MLALLALLGIFLPIPTAIAAFVFADRERARGAGGEVPHALLRWPLGIIGLAVCVAVGIAGFQVPTTALGDAAGNTLVLALMVLACAGASLGAASFGQRRARWAGVLAILIGAVEWVFGASVLFLSNVGLGMPGRPLRRRGVPALPRVRRGRRADRPKRDPLPADLTHRTRRALARGWEEDARYEAASVPAFGHLACDLEIARAPEALVAWARRAEEEERGHARLCFGLASAYAGRAIDASPVPFAPPWMPRGETRAALLERLALDSLVDGCIGEHAAALGAALGAARANDPIVRHALARIAREETTHAELAWAVLEWLLREEPRLAAVLSGRLERLTIEAGSVSAPAPERDLAGHGRVSLAERKAHLRQASEEARRRLA